MNKDAGGNVVIGIAEMDLVKPPATITTYALGSCVGVVMYDKVTRCAGMVHVLLPSADLALVQEQGGALNKAKYASAGVQALFDLMIRNGARKGNITAKLVGGAHMFGKPSATNSLLNVGERNIAECKKAIAALGIPIIAEDTAGQYGRTITLYSETGKLHVKTVGRGEKDI